MSESRNELIKLLTDRADAYKIEEFKRLEDFYDFVYPEDTHNGNTDTLHQ